jgi:drug/metabolite transporter (DMT)-like permease
MKNNPIANSYARGALLIIAAEFMFASMGASIRHVSGTLDNHTVVFARNLIGFLLFIPLVMARSGLRLHTEVPALHLLRGLAGLGAMYCFFYAIAKMPLAQAMLLKLSAPLFIPFVALFWLGETFGRVVVTAVLVGFLGVGIILSPDLGTLGPVAAIALLGGALAAIAKVTVRRLSRSEPPDRTVFYFALIGTLVSSVAFLWSPQIPSPDQWPWLLAIGGFATLGQMLLTRGFAASPAARLGPFAFFSVVFAALMGWWFWSEPLSWTGVLGSILVLLAGIMVSRPDGARLAEESGGRGADPRAEREAAQIL